ncbi:aspartate dehydrogenase [Methanobacterium congolense]|uniref:L-aspartate dehydrogenase n=1 Tax=Methanobacterium congolense TaxID=118062 RepID=A0A1D3L1C2_9EURY|nr:aspartate dehydrogenase [Methanobacterium congolense]SCG85462.1 putative L-aspartate dehydrogenase [Methanobacterium congolense]
MNRTLVEELMETKVTDATFPVSGPENSLDPVEKRTTVVGIVGCGAIARTITDFALKENLGVHIKFFYDQDMKRAEDLASHAGGVAVQNVQDMLSYVDLIVEAASPGAVMEIVPKVLESKSDVIIMSLGALMDQDLKHHLEDLAKRNDSRIYMPSGAIAGLDGVKSASIGEIREVSLVTRKPPRSLGISTDTEKVLYDGKASGAVRKFPANINVAAALSIACGMEADVKIVADPKIDRNCHEIHVVGDFGEITTTTQNMSCKTNPKTSLLAAYSVIKLLKTLNEHSRRGT